MVNLTSHHPTLMMMRVLISGTAISHKQTGHKQTSHQGTLMIIPVISERRLIAVTRRRVPSPRLNSQLGLKPQARTACKPALLCHP